jgi:CheY-like chemotaxis protein
MVTIYSELDVGTTVRVYLPCCDAPPVTATADGSELHRGTGETVLLVDDEAAVRKVATRILERNGYHVVQAADGVEALALAADHAIDLVVSDLVMPRMSGPELAEKLAPVRPGIRVLFVSGYSQGVVGPRQDVDDGAPLIQKPFSERSLTECVHLALHDGQT